MQKKRTQKLSNAAVATVLASSGALVALPQQSFANTFTDLNPKADYYKPVLELAAKGIVKGYENNGIHTFRPNASVTRGQAAKMLAMSLGLNTTNVRNPNFKDVSTSNSFYPYIAALANAGIISGFTDRTFRSTEPITRGQMAKIITLGYKFTVASKLSHNFKDVAANYSHAYYIQTLADLGITKGTTATTFAPGKAVTRGQLATFISRANNADAGVPKFVVTDVVGDKVYINSVAHTVSSNLSAIFNVKNREALIGAYVEGQIVGTTLTTLSKLTINNNGTAARQITLDGGNSVYNGELHIVGSYVTFRNWTLNGKTVIAETPRKTLADYIPTFASTNLFGYIDFTKPTDPGKDPLNPPGSGELKPGGNGPTTTYTARMSSISKYVDFSNSIVKNLIIQQNRTYVKASRELPKVTVERDVEYVEIYADMDTLYIESELNLTLYGVHNIKTVFKNSYRDVVLDTDSYITTMIVDNSYGWIDLGDHVYIEKVIIPPGKNPLDIFDDYQVDTDKIGTIEDTDGKEVDRNPIEDTVIKDVEPPKVLRLRVDGDSFTATTMLRTNEDGKYYYSVVERGAEAPTVRQILQGHGVTSGSGEWIGNIDDTFIVRNLESETEYDFYLVFVDNAGNISQKEFQEFETKDGTPPEILNLKLNALAGGKRFDMTFNPSEEGTYYYYYEQGSRVSNHTVDYIIAKGEEGEFGGKGETGAHFEGLEIKERLSNLSPETPYYVYVVMIDNSGNKSTAVTYTMSTTTILDDVHPYVTGKDAEDRKLVPNVTGNNINALNEFYIYFNEELDQATAEDVNNYVLSGTGIVNVPGQEPIKPSQAIYSKHGKGSKVLLKVPSLTGFINGDTLRVTVLPPVMDLAENEFTNINTVEQGQPVYNYAEYKHEDPLMPNILDLSILRNEDGTLAEITYTATKAGTVYYMIMPEDTDLEALEIEPKDFIDEFSGEPSGKFDKPLNSGKLYLEGAGNLVAPRTAELGTQMFNYDLSLLNPDPFVSYKLFMVLRDRSGNLSPIESDIIIADKEAPKIGNLAFESVISTKEEADDTKARITIEADEKGTAMYAVLPKYVLNGQNKYVLNPTIYNSGGTFKDLPGTTLGTNETREENFKRALGSVRNAEFIKGSTNTVDVTGLTPHREYVLVMAVKDTFGNFTTKATDGQLMYRELYADGTIPYIDRNIAFRSFDNSLTITFNEAIMRQYIDLNPLEKSTLEQTSTINASTPLASIMTLTDDSGADITSQYKLRSYTLGTSADNMSQLVIEPISSAINVERTVNIKMNSSIEDQVINENKGHAFDVNDFGKYEKRDLQLAFAELQIVPYTNRRGVSAIFDIIGTEIQYKPDEKMRYYYQSYSLNTPQNEIQGISAQVIIESVLENSGTAASLAKGKGEMIVNQQRAQATLSNEVAFIVGDWLVVAIEDDYGNRTVLSGKVQEAPPQQTP